MSKFIFIFLGLNVSALPMPLKYSNPSYSNSKSSPVSVSFERAKDELIARFQIASNAIHAKEKLEAGEYPYDFDVVEVFVTADQSALPRYFEFEVSPHNQGLQVNVIKPRQEFHFGVK